MTFDFEFSFDNDSDSGSEDSSERETEISQYPVAQKSPRELEADNLMSRIEEINSKLDSYQSLVLTPLSESVTQYHKTLEANQDAYRTEMRLVREKWEATILEDNDKVNKAKRELEDAKSMMWELRSEMDKLNKEHNQILAEMAAKKAYAEVEARLASILDAAPFNDYILSFQLNDLMHMVTAFESGKSGIINANFMGAGKTFESIALDYVLDALFPQSIDPKTGQKFNRKPRVLWLTVPSLIKQTVREILKWNPGRAVVPVLGSWNREMREQAVKMAVLNNAMVVTNYDATSSTPSIKATDWDILFCDEVSKLKGGANPSGPTKLWQNVKDIVWECDAKGNFTDPYAPVAKVRFFVPMSGTPIQNKPGDMWAYLHLFEPTRFPKLKRFEDEYAYGWPKMHVDWKRIINILKDQVVSNDRDAVMPELPEMVYDIRDVGMTDAQERIYNQMRDNMYIWLDDQKEHNLSATVVIAWIIRLWQIAMLPSQIKIFDTLGNETIPVSCDESGLLDEVMELIVQLIAEEEQVVVFSSHFNGPLEELQRRINELPENGHKPRCELITGDTKRNHDNYLVDFQDKKIDVLALNMKSGGMGLNLQNASHLIMLDQWWNPAVNEQAIRRVHRKGQENRVVIHQFNVENSVYAFVDAKVQEKQDMIEGIMNSNEIRKGSDWRKFLEGLI